MENTIFIKKRSEKNEKEGNIEKVLCLVEGRKRGNFALFSSDFKMTAKYLRPKESQFGNLRHCLR
jgi:hypothetical protein